MLTAITYLALRWRLDRCVLLDRTRVIWTALNGPSTNRESQTYRSAAAMWPPRHRRPDHALKNSLQPQTRDSAIEPHVLILSVKGSYHEVGFSQQHTTIVGLKDSALHGSTMTSSVLSAIRLVRFPDGVIS